MDRAFYQRVHDVLSEIADLDPLSQSAAVKIRCAGDTELCDAVLELLRAEQHADDLSAFDDSQILQHRVSLERVFDTGRVDSVSTAFPESIGAYRIIRLIGEGGMGIVYECEQRNPRRRVAVKVVDGFRGSPELHKRLINEAQIQGRLQHSAIAQVYEAGMTKFGERDRPYFAMELVHGRPIVSFCTDKAMGIRERLELLAKVADGLGRAHAIGVVHRDLKPDNILVESSGQPKILDFGIARVTTDASIAMTAMTRAGQVLGTLAYMAPEQLASDPDSVTPAADIYAIGVIAYELLAGRLPNELEGLSVVSAMHLLDSSVPMPIRRFMPALNRDIETIVMRCLRREPESRYQNADELASDIRRYLSNLPIRARPTSRAYRAQKFVKRHRLLVSAVSVTLLALSAGTVISTVFAVGQSRARIIADEQRRFAFQKELQAAGGVMAGAAILAEKNEPWSARMQLDTVRPDIRGWAWQHLSLHLPWIIDGTGRSETAASPNMAWNTVWVSDREMLWIDRDTGQASLFHVIEGSWTDLPNMPPIRSLPRWRAPKEGLVMATLDDKRIGILDIRSGSFEQVGTAIGESKEAAGPTAVSDDGRSMAWRQYYSDILRVHHDGEPILALRSGHVNLPEMNWHKLVFMPGSSMLIAGHWSSSTAPASLFVIDAEHGTVVERVEIGSAQSPHFEALSEHTLVGIHRSSPDIEIRSLPGLNIERVIDLDGLWPGSLAVSPDGSRLATVVGPPYTDRSTGTLRIIDLQTNRTILDQPVGANRLDRDPKFSPDGSLLAAWAPNTNRLWLLDTHQADSQRQPAFGPVTTLKGHSSWIYQIAISPDGSLLASAAPVGDILIWDLTLGEVIATVPRFHNEQKESFVAFNMDAPLLFDAAGETLVFGELDQDSVIPGLTTIDLDTGRRQWVQTGSLSATLDAAAQHTEPGKPATLYHHAAKLADGRILESRASIMAFNGVGIRRPGTTEREVEFFAGRRIEDQGGVAAAPDGQTIAADEIHAVHIRDAKTGVTRHILPDAASTSVYGMAFTNDGSRFAMCTEDGRLILYDTEFYTRLLEITVPPPEGSSRPYIFSMLWTPDDRRLVTTSGPIIRIFESERGVIRADRRERWIEDLARAQSASTDASTAARRAVRIRSWSTADQ